MSELTIHLSFSSIAISILAAATVGRFPGWAVLVAVISAANAPAAAFNHWIPG